MLSFVLNAGLNFLIGLLVAALLGPEEFGRYAIAFATANVINVVLFDWLRLSVLRFYSDRSRAEAPEIRATIGVWQAGLAGAALVAGAVLFGFRLDLGLAPALAAAAIVTAVAAGAFEYHVALARARFLDRGFALLVIAKNLAAFVLMVGGAFIFRDGTVVLLGSVGSVALALLLVRRTLRDAQAKPRLADREVLERIARYAVPLVLANIVYQAIPLANRTALAGAYGFAAAGYFSLAADIGVRLFATLGSALDILLFQLAVRADETQGRDAARAQIARNIGVVLAIMLPGTVGFWLVLPAFEALLIPPAFRGPFGAQMAILIPALFAFAMIQYALNPVFQVAKRTGPTILAALAALGVNLALLWLLPRIMGPLGFAAAQLGGMLAALAVAAALALRSGDLALPLRDAARALLATLVMAAAIWPLRGLDPAWAALAGGVLLGGMVYGGMAYALDIAGVRGLLKGLIARRAAARHAPAE